MHQTGRMSAIAEPINTSGLPSSPLQLKRQNAHEPIYNPSAYANEPTSSTWPFSTAYERGRCEISTLSLSESDREPEEEEDSSSDSPEKKERKSSVSGYETDVDKCPYVINPQYNTWMFKSIQLNDADCTPSKEPRVYGGSSSKDNDRECDEPIAPMPIETRCASSPRPRCPFPYQSYCGPCQEKKKDDIRIKKKVVLSPQPPPPAPSIGTDPNKPSAFQRVHRSAKFLQRKRRADKNKAMAPYKKNKEINKRKQKQVRFTKKAPTNIGE